MEQSQASEPPSLVDHDSTSIDLINAIRILRSAGKALFSQAALHVQLARIEWVKERNRLLQMVTIALLGFASLMCVLLFTGAMVLALSWETVYRIPAAIVLIAIYVIGACIAWSRLRTLSAQSGQAFAASCEELAADVALIKSKL